MCFLGVACDAAAVVRRRTTHRGLLPRKAFLQCFSWSTEPTHRSPATNTFFSAGGCSRPPFVWVFSPARCSDGSVSTDALSICVCSGRLARLGFSLLHALLPAAYQVKIVKDREAPVGDSLKQESCTYSTTKWAVCGVLHYGPSAGHVPVRRRHGRHVERFVVAWSTAAHNSA
jgi:hypothetical protein